jgi:hypothetical protein
VANWAKGAHIEWPNLPPQITDRDADVWEPLIAIADAVGGTWPDRARVAGVALVADAREVEPSLGIKLLGDVRLAFGDADELSSKALLLALYDIEESTWSDFKGKPLNERGLSTRLRQYGVKSKTIRVGSTTPKGYRRVDLLDVWSRYLPSAPTSATSATSATNSGNGAAPPLAEHHHVADVADVAHLGGGGRRQ